MKLKNFRNLTTKVVKNGWATDTYHYATVEIHKRGFWPFVKPSVVQVGVFRKFPMHWRFLDTGDFCPGYSVENMYEAYEASKVSKNETKQTPR